MIDLTKNNTKQIKKLHQFYRDNANRNVDKTYRKEEEDIKKKINLISRKE